MQQWLCWINHGLAIISQLFTPPTVVAKEAFSTNLLTALYQLIGPLQIHTGSSFWNFKSWLKIALTFHGNMTAEKALVKAWEEKGACRIRESSLFSLSSRLHLNLLIMSAAAGNHLCSWEGITVLLVALLTCVPPIQPPPAHSSHSKCLSPAELISSRSKKDWFVCVCLQRGAEWARRSEGREKERGEDKGMSRGGLLPRSVFTQRFTPAVSQASRWTSSQTTCLFSCRVHSPVSACLPV